jgi:hypothetical protein
MGGELAVAVRTGAGTVIMLDSHRHRIARASGVARKSAARPASKSKLKVKHEETAVASRRPRRRDTGVACVQAASATARPLRSTTRGSRFRGAAGSRLPPHRRDVSTAQLHLAGRPRSNKLIGQFYDANWSGISCELV